MWRRDEQRAAHALDRYLQGVRVSAIAAELSLSPSTVRRWITLQLKQIAGEERAARVEQLQAAIESQRAILREAWVAYHREQTREDQRLTGALDHPRRRALRGAHSAYAQPDASGQQTTAGAEGATSAAPARPEGHGAGKDYARPTRANHAATYLRLAGAAQREIARLQGLYSYQQPPDDHITITVIERPNDPENQPPFPSDEGPHWDMQEADRPDGVSAACDAIPVAQTTQLVQTAQLSQTPDLARPAGLNQPFTHKQRKRLHYLQALQQQPAHQVWSRAYSGP